MTKEECQKIIDRVNRLSASEKVAEGKKAVADIDAYLKKIGKPEKKRMDFVIHLISLAVSGDRMASNEEYDFFVKILAKPYSFNEFFELTNGGASPCFIKEMDGYIDLLPDETKRRCCVLIAVFFAADYRFSKDESAVLNRICS